MSDVVSLRAAESVADPDVIESLERALEMARSGELRSVAIVGDLTGGRTLTDFATRDMGMLIGHLTLVQHTVCARMREGAEPC